MTLETATPTGVETEVKTDPVPNPRNEMLAEIARKTQQERDEEIRASGGEVVDTKAPEEPEQKEPEAQEPEQVVEPVAETAPEAAKEPEPELVTVKVDGEIRQVPKDKIYEAGLRAVQKESAADKRLEEATRLLKEVESRLTQVTPQQNPNPSPQPSVGEWDDSIIAYALEHGNEEQKTEAVRQLRGRQQQQATPEQIAAFAEARVLDKVDFQTSAQWFTDTYKEVVKDPYLLQLAAIKEDQMRKAGDNRSRKELYKEIGDSLMQWRGGAVPTTTLEQKREQKATITNLPSASVRKAAPETQKPKSPSDIIEDMRKRRGQAA